MITADHDEQSALQPIPIAPPAPKKRNIFRIFYRASIGRLIGRTFHDQIPCMGCVIDTHSPLVVPRIKAKLFLRGYEHVEIRLVKKYLRSDRDVIDLGSGLGVVAAHIGRKLQVGQRLICVEAQPALWGVIQTNVNRNAPHVQLDIVSGAVAYPIDHRPCVKLELGIDHLVAHIVDGGPSKDCLSVPALALSDVLREHAIGEYTLVSDIEGSEAGLLEMDGEALRHCRQMIIELHHTVWRGRVILMEELASELCVKHGFRPIERWGSVLVLEK